MMINNSRIVCIRGLVISLSLLFIAGCINKPIEQGPEITKLTHNNFRNLVTKHEGAVLVYFSQHFSDKNIIKSEFEDLFEENNDLVEFGQFEVNSDDVSQYQVTKFPAVNYYYNGRLVDQLASVPVNIESQLELAKDMQLWFYETVLTIPGTEKQFTYVFNGGHQLDFHPY